MSPTVLFVYGTLKRGQRNHRLIADQRFLGPAVTAPRYRVFDLGSYPGLTLDADRGLRVAGELWEVAACCLDELDDFEGVPELFDRRTVEVAGVAHRVEGYFWVRAVPSAAPSGDRWPLR